MRGFAITIASAISCITAILSIVFLAVRQSTASGGSPADALVVRGVVQEKEAQRPIAGVIVVLSNGSSDVRVESDADGRYECRLAPGIVTAQIVGAPPKFIRPLRAFRAPVVIAADRHEAVLPPIELQRGNPVHGHVLDGEGRPVRGANVHAVWHVFEPWQEGRIGGGKSLVTKTNEKGDFVFRGIDPVIDRQPQFWAASRDGATEAVHTLPTQPDALLELKLSRNGGVRLFGRVTDAAGHGVGGAHIEVWTQWRKDTGIVLGEAPVTFAGHRKIISNERGEFETPRVLSRGGEYQVRVRPEGFIPASSAWHRPGPNAVIETIDLALQPLQTLSGQVVDVAGRPVSGARVFPALDGRRANQATSGDDGRFSLSGVADGGAFVFAEREGYRFAGQAVEDATAIRIVLRRQGEPTAPLLTASPLLSREQELELARRVVRPYVDRALESAVRNDRFWALITWARLDPGDALERLGGIPDLTSDNKDVLRTYAAKSLLYGDRDEAGAVAASIENASRRAEANALLAVTGPTSGSQAREYLERVVLCARQEEPGTRALWLESAADGLLDLGELERARSLLDEARDEAAAVPMAGSAGSARPRVAEVLARIDLTAALDLVKGTAEDAYRTAAYGQIAHRIARQQPADSERVLAMVVDRWRRERWAERVCSRMAPADPSRAERLVGLITNPYRRALTLGWVAGAQAASDKAQARLWLDQAFAELGRLAAAESRLSGPQSAAVAAALLLPVAETIDPQLTRECFWRAMSFRRVSSDGDGQQALIETAALALLLARYDRQAARRLLEPIVELLRLGVVNDISECSATAINAMCSVDPQWAVDFLRQPSLGNERPRFDDNAPWVVFAWFLGTPPEARTRRFLRDYLNGQYWLPGGPDNPFHDRF